MLRRALIALAVALVVGGFHLARHAATGESDLWLAYGAAQELIAGRSPYGYPTGGWPANPMPTILAVLPLALAGAPLGVAGALWVGAAAGLYAWAVIGRGEAWRLVALLSAPAILTMHYAQWGILLLAIWFVPRLAPLTLVKPHAGWAIGLLRTTPGRAAGGAAILAACWLLAPGWLGDWLAQVGEYSGAIPALGVAGLGLLVLLRRRDRDALLYAGLLCSPARALYDPVTLWAVVPSRRAALALCAASYAVVPLALAGVPFMAALALGCYLPAGAALLLGRHQAVEPGDAARTVAAP